MILIFIVIFASLIMHRANMLKFIICYELCILVLLILLSTISSLLITKLIILLVLWLATAELLVAISLIVS